ncbi:hypothetical protein BC629DRAFT_1056791 [Irpex lacteus]|nr:hypothetical protein BC629DRAFT_1056791 [Irpex lacteus]
MVAAIATGTLKATSSTAMQVPETISDSRGSPALQQDSNEWEDIHGSVASPPLEPKKARNLQRGSVCTHPVGRRGRRPSLTSRTLRNNQRQWQESHTSGPLETAETSTRDQTRLVLSGQPTGWTAMARSVRDFDEEKVRDCKEDIDTLLVFAGLFSAVLTAFLVESYKNLVEDPTTQTLLAIRQLVSQTSSYRVEGGMLNTTVLPYSPEPFQVSRADIRVNVLWFASLLFSLITASFGILVKQWLREFLAVENPSPRARLRVRHVRYPQLVQWRVFQIAAVLPLLLQLSLALFFVGLCYFTASVHSSVEYTALPLVLGWTVCFCTVMVLPVFLPWCPYRTALLRNLLQRLHRVARRVADRVANACLAVLARPTPLSQWLKVCLRQVERTCAQASATLAEQDEAQIIRRAENDMAILESVDSIQSDDDLLGTAIAEAVDHVLCSPSQFESFLQKIFENRGYSDRHAVVISNQTDSDEQMDCPFPLPILDLRRISIQARNAICTIVSHYASDVRLNAGPIITEWTIDREAYRMILV